MHCICCGRSDSENDTISFETFPRDSEILAKWLTFLQKPPGWEPPEDARVCSLHFLISDLYPLYRGTRRWLRSTAVPSLGGVSSPAGSKMISSPPGLGFTLFSGRVGLKDAVNGFCPVLDKRFPQITLKVGLAEEEIIASPHFLALGSPFFNNKIREDNQHEPILLPGLEPSVVNLIISFLYTGCLEILAEDVRGLLIASTAFEIIEIQNAALEFMASQLTCQNYWDTRKFAGENALQPLSDKCDEFLSEQLKELSNTIEFLDLQISELQRVFSIINTEGEIFRQPPPKEGRAMDMLSAVILWGNHDLESRIQYLHSLVSEVNLMEILDNHTMTAFKEAFMGEGSPLRNCQSCKILYWQACEAKLLQNSEALANGVIPNPNHTNNNYNGEVIVIDEPDEEEIIIKIEPFEIEVSIGNGIPSPSGKRKPESSNQNGGGRPKRTKARPEVQFAPTPSSSSTTTNQRKKTPLAQTQGTPKKRVSEYQFKKALKVIQERLKKKRCDPLLIDNWYTLWFATDENPDYCEKFLRTSGGMDLFFGCLHVFPNKPELLMNMTGVLGNIAEVPDLRPELSSYDIFALFYDRLDPIKNSLEVSCSAAGVLAHLLSDGVEAWKCLSPSREAVLKEMTQAITSWDYNVIRDITYRTLQPIIRLLTIEDTSVCQLWSAWLLANLTIVNPSKYCPLLDEEGGVELLQRLVDPNSRVLTASHYFASLAIAQVQEFLSVPLDSLSLNG